jgi:hypothetical protein
MMGGGGGMMGGGGGMMGGGGGGMMGGGGGMMGGGGGPGGGGMMGGGGGGGGMMGGGGGPGGGMMGMGGGGGGGAGRIRWRGRSVVIVRGPRFIRWGGRTRRIIAISALPVAVGVVTIAGRRYRADGYPALAATPDVCTGVTEEGCQLQIADVPMEDGGTAQVCVQYCPWEDSSDSGTPATPVPAQ